MCFFCTLGIMQKVEKLTLTGTWDFSKARKFWSSKILHGSTHLHTEQTEAVAVIQDGAPDDLN